MATAAARGVMRLALVALVLGGCSFPLRSESLTCSTDNDCDSERACESGLCVASNRRSVDAQTISEDSAPEPDAAQTPDADAFEAIKAMCQAKGYTAATGVERSLFRSVGTGAQWTAANNDCKDDVPGATHLIVLSSQAEVTFMKSQLGWVGLFDNATNVFKNVTDEPNDLRPFDSGQPDNGGGDENCVQMKSTSGLDDDQCNNNHRYVCECDGRASTI